MSPTDRERFRKCLALAERGATDGERAAARAAAERIAAGAGMTLAEARAGARRAAAAGPVPGAGWPRPPRSRPYGWARPKEPVQPVTVAEMLRQRAETEAWRRRRTAASDRVRAKDLEAQAVWEAKERAAQAERDRAWAEGRVKADD